ncbi:glycosyltransferase family 2 protein [Candidatus Parcubacteria bacterium]|nr:glycosyltransferase family 2 protein [Candidatus Parcubacteria bacterium]
MLFSSLMLYISLFVALFFEVFLLITYFEIREEIKFEEKHNGKDLTNYPSVTIIVPCYNEESTVASTIRSLLSLQYPKDKLKLIVVDDGSTDNTQKSLEEFTHHPQIQTFKKENGGKHTALNFALERVDTELVGCLDADSFVEPEALKRIVGFFTDEATMAVTPSIKIHEPISVLQHVQKVEYNWGIFLRRVLSSINGLYVTPGPFSIFRTRIFKEIGGYREAYLTEDMEMALRMHRNHYKIVNSHNAYVYTVAPSKLSDLYKQRVRWAYGFLNNAVDYRDMYFNKKYGNIGIFVLPIATFSVFSTLYAAGNALWSIFSKIPDALTRYQAVGFAWNFNAPHFSVDWFTFNTGITAMITYTTIILSLTLLYLALALAEGKVRLKKDVLYYLTIYILIVPLWLAKATYSTLARKPITWR